MALVSLRFFIASHLLERGLESPTTFRLPSSYSYTRVRLLSFRVLENDDTSRKNESTMGEEDGDPIGRNVTRSC